MKSKYEVIKPSENQDVVIQLINLEIVKDMKKMMEITSGIPAHWHRSIEFSYVRRGEIELTIHNTTRKLKQGDFIFVNSSQIHQLHSDDVENSEVILLIIPYSLLKNAILAIDEIVFDIYSKSYDPLFYQIFDFFYETLTNPKTYDRLKIDAYVYMLLYLLMSKYQVENVDINYLQNHRFQHELLDYIEENYRYDLTLKSLADSFNLSHEHVSRLFKQLFGINFKTYLTQYRLQACLIDVVYSHKSIQDISLEYGFSNVKAFISAFKKYYKITPYQYRLKNKE